MGVDVGANGQITDRWCVARYLDFEQLAVRLTAQFQAQPGLGGKGFPWSTLGRESAQAVHPRGSESLICKNQI
jgi:hypothetical protein